jgi:hypothetical protein
MKVVMVSFLFLFATFLVSGQIQRPQIPQPATFQPSSGATSNDSYIPQSQQQTPIGGNVQDVINRQNQAAMQRMGYNIPDPNNPQGYLERQKYLQRQEQSYEATKELEKLSLIQSRLPSHSGEKGTEPYQHAFDQLNDMLKGKTSMDIKRAVFIVENAYLENKLQYSQYENHIQNIAQFCKLRMKQEKISSNDNVAKNNLLFRLMSDTLSVRDPASGKIITHYPVHYDFDDPFGYEDRTKMFVTKLMASNYGQCHSMPLLYLIIANEIDARAYLATSPSHTYIKYRSGHEWKNVELTNGHMSTDAFVMGSGYIKSQALKNHLYMDTLSLKQTIANMMEDLAKGYSSKFGFDEFVLKCLDSALQYYPNSWYGLGQKSDYYTFLFKHIVTQANERGYTTPQQVLSIPEARQAYDQMHAMYDRIDNIGYVEMPKEAYEEWIKLMDVQKREQQLKDYRQWIKLNKPIMNSLTK